jgi:hypothetical protein
MGFLLNAQVRGHPGCELTVRRGRQTLAPDDAAGGGRGTSIRTGGAGSPCEAGQHGRTGSGLRGADGAFREGFAKSRMAQGYAEQMSCQLMAFRGCGSPFHPHRKRTLRHTAVVLLLTAQGM